LATSFALFAPGFDCLAADLDDLAELFLLLGRTFDCLAGDLADLPW
jgi:hypothetical protein